MEKTEFYLTVWETSLYWFLDANSSARFPFRNTTICQRLDGVWYHSGTWTALYFHFDELREIVPLLQFTNHHCREICLFENRCVDHNPSTVVRWCAGHSIFPCGDTCINCSTKVKFLPYVHEWYQYQSTHLHFETGLCSKLEQNWEGKRCFPICRRRFFPVLW